MEKGWRRMLRFGSNKGDNFSWLRGIVDYGFHEELYFVICLKWRAFSGKGLRCSFDEILDLFPVCLFSVLSEQKLRGRSGIVDQVRFY